MEFLKNAENLKDLDGFKIVGSFKIPGSLESSGNGGFFGELGAREISKSMETAKERKRKREAINTVN